MADRKVFVSRMMLKRTNLENNFDFNNNSLRDSEFTFALIIIS